MRRRSNKVNVVSNDLTVGLAGAALFLAGLSFVIPLLGTVTTILAMLFGALAALAGARVAALITGCLGVTSLLIANETFLLALSVTAETGRTSAFVFHLMALASTAFPFVGVVLNKRTRR